MVEYITKSIRDNTKSSYGFNTGYTPAFHSEISKGLSKTDKKEIKGIHTNYHVSGDLVSTALNNNSLGEVQVVKAAKGSTILDKHSLENFTGDNDDL